MRLTIEIDTTEITAEDRRVLMALAGHDAGELRITMLDDPPAERIRTGTNPGPVPPLPVPAPPEFAARLGEAVGQFSPRGSGSEARLPFAQQAGVRTSSTMPDEDEPAEVVDAGAILEAELADRMERAELGPNAARGDADMRVPDVERPDVIMARGGTTVPRDLVEDDGAPRRIEDVTGAAILGVVEQPPVRHTSP